MPDFSKTFFPGLFLPNLRSLGSFLWECLVSLICCGKIRVTTGASTCADVCLRNRLGPTDWASRPARVSRTPVRGPTGSPVPPLRASQDPHRWVPLGHGGRQLLGGLREERRGLRAADQRRTPGAVDGWDLMHTSPPWSERHVGRSSGRSPGGTNRAR